MILLKCWRYRHMYYWRIYNFVTEMRFAVRKSTAFVKNKKRKHCKINVSASYMRAADGNRTRDLRTTNATLYRLSHSSICNFHCKSARRDSNPRPRPWQGRTPPTEPLAHYIIHVPSKPHIEFHPFSYLNRLG